MGKIRNRKEKLKNRKLRAELNNLKAQVSLNPDSLLARQFGQMQDEIVKRGNMVQSLVDVVVPIVVRVNNWIVSGEMKNEEKEEMLSLCNDIIKQFYDNTHEVSEIVDIVDTTCEKVEEE